MQLKTPRSFPFCSPGDWCKGALEDVSNPLIGSYTICIFFLSSNLQSTKKSETGQSSDYPGGSSIALSVLVSRLTVALHSTTDNFSPIDKHNLLGLWTRTPSGSKIPSPHGLQAFWLASQIGDVLVRLRVSLWSVGSRQPERSYFVKWKCSSLWMKTKQFSPLKLSVPLILDLQSLRYTGLLFNSIKFHLPADLAFHSPFQVLQYFPILQLKYFFKNY